MNTLPDAPAHIHIVGIGGAGMSAIARVLLGRGYMVSGSDRQPNAVSDALAQDGAVVYIGHAAEQIAGAQLVLISSAVPPDNPEVLAANAVGVPVLKRREALGALTAGYDVIAVAGTHGKTTTSALITHLLIEAGLDPTYIVGGVLLNTGTNAGVGKSNWFVIEADEYDMMFLGLHPKIAVITNIEHDHPDMFATLADVLDAFRQFADHVRPDGMLVVCAEDRNASDLAHKVAKPIVFYGEWYPGDANVLDYLVQDICDTSIFSGRHNLLNADATITVAKQLGIPKEDAIKMLCSFKGVARRMELIGTTADNVAIYSDYGHHPTAIKATLDGASDRFPGQSCWAVWQPHTYSRTHLLAREFSEAFARADHVLITDIYAAREQPSPGPTEDDIAQMAREAGHRDARHSGSLAATADILRRETQPGDVVIIFSAGDAPTIADRLLQGE